MLYRRRRKSKNEFVIPFLGISVSREIELASLFALCFSIISIGISAYPHIKEYFRQETLGVLITGEHITIHTNVDDTKPPEGRTFTQPAREHPIDYLSLSITTVNLSELKSEHVGLLEMELALNNNTYLYVWDDMVTHGSGTNQLRTEEVQAFRLRSGQVQDREYIFRLRKVNGGSWRVGQPPTLGHLQDVLKKGNGIQFNVMASKLSLLGKKIVLLTTSVGDSCTVNSEQFNGVIAARVQDKAGPKRSNGTYVFNCQ